MDQKDSMSKYTDRSEHTIGSGSILLFQPSMTVGLSREQLRDKGTLQAALSETMGFDLIHIGSLDYNTHNDQFGGPYALGPQCGGRLVLKSSKETRWSLRYATGNFIACSNPQCGAELVTSYIPTREMLADAMLHLAMKQMVPSLSTANYLNCCAKTHTSDETEKKKIDAIRQLGLISFLHNALTGYIDNGYFHQKGQPQMMREFSLGFMLVPGMNTIDGCDGYDQWLQLLVEKKFEQLLEQHRALRPTLLGFKSS